MDLPTMYRTKETGRTEKEDGETQAEEVDLPVFLAVDIVSCMKMYTDFYVYIGA